MFSNDSFSKSQSVFQNMEKIHSIKSVNMEGKQVTLNSERKKGMNMLSQLTKVKYCPVYKKSFLYKFTGA